MALSLLIMAAGLGSRFGGNKPLAEVGPNGQALFEYSVYDAIKAGIKHMVFVVNAQQDTTEFSDRLKHYTSELKIDFVVQSLCDATGDVGIPQAQGRKNPWGTAHAVLVCREFLRNPFMVINADDYYGPSHYNKIGNYLLGNSVDEQRCALPGYRLENTLSPSGGVNRGICELDPDDFLKSIHEVKNIRRDQSTRLLYDQTVKPLSLRSNSIVSMTFWGFVPSVFKLLDAEFKRFLMETSDLLRDEFLLPRFVNQAISTDKLKVKMFDTEQIWKGLTFAEDLPEVRLFIKQLSASGLYSDMSQT